MIIVFHPWVEFSSSNTSINIDTVYQEINISFNTETMLYYYFNMAAHQGWAYSI